MATPNSEFLSPFNPDALSAEQQTFTNRVKGGFLQTKYAVEPHYVFTKEHIMGLFDADDTQLEVFFTIRNKKLHVYLQAQGPGGTGDVGGTAAGSPVV